MPVRGRIVRISGPLVVAEGMRGVQMYEMVRVGEEGLIGEVTRIRGDEAYIQVYESTSGLRPGEPVEGTGAPLSVELGPGLLGMIYDGVQRPLPRIAEEIARKAPHRRMFIERGIKVPALDREKKWTFHPGDPDTGRVLKPGDKVEPGDVLGWVQETSIITHKIMVPPGVHGTLKWLAGEGDYTVEDVIAEVEADGETRGVKMMHRWPVRVPRPYKVKLDPTEPLITGMRIIDTFFPMAKGGTGAIPGGFGTGKCVPPDTPVLLASGELLAIEDLYKRYSRLGSVVYSTGDETVIDVSHLGLRVLSFDGRRLVEDKITHLYRGKSRYLVRIRTRSGREIRVTPPHKLLRLTSDGRVEEVPAAELKVGDQILVPRLITIKGSPQELDPYKLGLAEATVRDPEVLAEVQLEIRRLAKRFGSLKSLAEKLGVNPKTLEAIANGRSRPRLALVERLFKLAGKKPPRPARLGLPRSRLEVRLPSVVDDELAELLGLLMADGMITDREVRFFSSSELLRRRFSSLVKKLFGLNAVESKFNTVEGVKVDSRLLVKILEALGVPRGGKARRAAVPPVILSSPTAVVAAFLRGYYLGDGGFGKNEVEFTTASREMATGLTYLLSRLGILYSVGLKHVEGRPYWRVIITSLDEIERFYNAISAPWAEGHEKMLRLRRYIETRRQGRKARDAISLSPSLLEEAAASTSNSILRASGVVLSNYTKRGERIGAAKLTVLAAITGDERLSRLAEMLRYVAVDEVVSIDVIEGDFTVYDVTVERTHNFVGGHTPLILHNTVTLHSLAQWSAARVVIYIGCGERGNEMTEVLVRFPKYTDPWTGKPLMDRTILIANTSNMPVAAREASIYVGVTLAEYYRDMGYDVLLVADSTSRWAEALREIAGRLEEMPAEEGYPSYLASRLAEFYERAGRVEALGRPERTGSVTIVGAVSPPGGDFTEPVTSHTKRFIRVFWALDTKLAYSRHYPAINWIISYSAYVDLVEDWWHKNVDPRWRQYRDEAMEVLTREEELMEIVRLVGTESLEEKDKLVLDAARLIKDGFLKQNAFDPIDAFSPPEKQFKLLQMIMDYYRKARELVEKGATVAQIREAVGRLYVDMAKAKFEVPNDKLELIDELRAKVLKALEELEARLG